MKIRNQTVIQGGSGVGPGYVEFGEGEELRVEISTRFRPDRLNAELADAGFEVDRFWNADDDDFALVLAQRADYHEG